MPRNVLTTDQLPPVPARVADDRTYTADDQGAGWLVFAGTMLAIVGALNVVYGIAATSNSKFFVRDVEYVLGSLNTWGWVMIAIGAIQLVAAFSVWAGRGFGRWVGVFSAGGNAVIQMLAIPSYPLLALSLFAIDILIIYGLVSFGGRGAQVA
ncbi:MAG TPA: hypothetical protein VK501_27430 [Baekduia sp.]|uniref:DUF7144 family membrane protein n=1 Tax=Baekduia sp. TaxID=2600305 RepID=UPI002D0C44AC|nr:hypothetical protein [Baekduia sp.]HMJ37669.1 hypothetical protein [Baekduia sp.]